MTQAVVLILSYLEIWVIIFIYIEIFVLGERNKENHQ